MKSYLELGPCIPYLVRAGNTFTGGDFDGDGRQEIASYCPANNSLNILSYFLYGDVTPGWAAASAGQLVNAWACTQSVPPGPALSPATGWTLQNGDQYFGAGLTGSPDSLFVFSPSRAMVGVLQWAGQQMQTLFVSPANQIMTGVGLNAADQFIFADIDGDGCQEVIMYSPNDRWLFTLKWNAGQASFETLSAQQSEIQGEYPWPIGQQTIYLKIHPIAGAGDMIVGFDPNALNICLIDYASQLAVLWPVQKVSFPFGFPSMLVADVDGDGADEVVISGNDGDSAFDVLVLKWDPSAQAFATLVTPTSVGFLDGLFPVDLGGTGSDLFLFDHEASTASVFALSGSSLVWKWTSSGTVMAPYVGMNPADQFYAADVDGDGNDEVVMFSPNDEWLFAISWDGATTQAETAGQTSLFGWSTDLLLAAPITPFGPAPFSGNQVTVYQTVGTQIYPAISSPVTGCPNCQAIDIRGCYPCLAPSDFQSLQAALNSYVATQGPNPDLAAVATALTNDFIYGYISATLDPGCGADIRSEYLNTGYDHRDSFDQMAGQLQNPKLSNYIAQMPGTPAAAWDTLADQLAGELDGIVSVNEWAGADIMAALNLQMEQNQITALSNASAKVNESYTPDDSSSVTYWAEGAIDAAIWGVAAIAGLSAGLPIVLAIAASFYGTFTSYFGSSAKSQPPQSVQFGDLIGAVTQTFVTASQTLATQMTRIGSDPVLLPLLGGLFSGTPSNRLWTFSPDQLSDLVTAALAPSTVQYYTTLIPMRFNILIWQNVNSKTPYYCLPDGNYQGVEYYTVTSCDSPGYAYRGEQNSDGSWTFYMLCSGTDPSNLSYPSSDMISDLESLGVSMVDVFHGNGAWANLSRTVLQLPCRPI
jgi:hypothetical protein